MASGVTPQNPLYYDNTAYSNLIARRLILSSGESVELTEGSTMRFALIFANSSGTDFTEVIVGRWGNLVAIHPNNLLQFTWTGAVNTLGKLTAKNISNGYLQIAIFYPPLVYTKIEVAS